MADFLLIDEALWRKTRAGARAGRGFRYQDAVSAWLVAEGWRGGIPWTTVVPEGVDDVTLHGPDVEIRAQLKARHDPQRTFSLPEAASHLAKSAADLPAGWPNDTRLRLALVLERPLDGLVATGWGGVLTDSEQNLEPFTAALAVALSECGVDTAIAADLLSRIHLVVEPLPMDAARSALEGSGLTGVALGIAAQQLRELAGRAADENFRASAKEAVALGRSDVQARIDSLEGLIDPAAYLELTQGLADLADFATPLPGAGFYEGVNVAPGHVAAGLVFERAEPMADLLAGLEQRRVALVAGPSGAGKSALAWLAAHHTRHAVRWYRLRRLQPEDVARIALLARRLDVDPQRPVGFVVDDVGRADTAGWDALVREIESLPGVMAIGTVREEDVFLLATAARTPTVRPILDEPVAARIWQSLKDGGQTKFSHWREPFVESRGLLLEYVHLLTAGQRLAETISEQVRRRLEESRAAELAILRAVSFAAAHGGDVDGERLCAAEGLTQIEFARALQRLVAEHALREHRDGRLTGLHEIRSAHLDAALRERLGESVSAALRAAAETLAPASFGPFIVRVLRGYPDEADSLLDVLKERIRTGGVETWVPIFHGLGLATCDLIAARWLEASRAENIEDRHSGTSFGLALSESDLSGLEMFEPTRRAIATFAAGSSPDLRQRVLECLPASFEIPPLGLVDANRLAAALLPVFGAATPDYAHVPCVDDLSTANLTLVLQRLEIAGARERHLAVACALEAGGTDHLLDRIYHEHPWATRPELGVDDSGVRTVTAHLRYVHPEVQPDANDAVVKLCDRLAAAAPEADFIVSNVIAPDGEPVSFGNLPLAAKRMPRRNLTASSRIAWNRAQLRAIARLVAAPTSTQRTTDLANAVREVSAWVREAGDFYCRHETPGPYWKALLHIRRLLTTLVPPPRVNEAVNDPLSNGELPGHDRLHGFITDLQRLMGDLTDGVTEQPRLVASRAASIAHDAKILEDPVIWVDTADPPLEPLAKIEGYLWDIRAVLGDAAEDAGPRRRAALRFSKTSRKHSVLARAATQARERAEAEAARQRHRIAEAFSAAGVTAQVVSRYHDKDKGIFWPAVDYAAVVEVESLIEFLQLEPVFASVAEGLELSTQLSFAPVIQSRLPPLAFSFIRRCLPDLDFLERWGAILPFPPLPKDPASVRLDQAIDAISVLSARAAERNRDLRPDEVDFLEKMTARWQGAVEALAEIATVSEDSLVAEVVMFLARAGERLDAEVQAPTGNESIALDIYRVTQGVMTPFIQELMIARLLLMERAAGADLASASAVQPLAQTQTEAQPYESADSSN
ncbi:hypothetical protein [Xanthobacter autotrophicus]|uniref:hypothetical protein n=1 Tax=Xanthobacter autotrophicus TaxID=280 RepID=UPI00372671C0